MCGTHLSEGQVGCSSGFPWDYIDVTPSMQWFLLLEDVYNRVPGPAHLKNSSWVFDVMQHLCLLVAEAARRTIENLEKETTPDDPQIVEIKRRVLLLLADTQESNRPRRTKLLAFVNRGSADGE